MMEKRLRDLRFNEGEFDLRRKKKKKKKRNLKCSTQ